jgi:hypothetical protein
VAGLFICYLESWRNFSPIDFGSISGCGGGGHCHHWPGSPVDFQFPQINFDMENTGTDFKSYRQRGLRKSSGSLAIFAAILRASSLLSSLAAEAVHTLRARLGPYPAARSEVRISLFACRHDLRIDLRQGSQSFWCPQHDRPDTV